MSDSPYPTCHHIHEDGTLCGSPALSGGRLCYFHQRDLDRLRNLRQARDVKSGYYAKVAPPELDAEILESLQLPLLEDPSAIQVAITNVLRALASRHLSVAEARAMLYGIRLAVVNFREFKAAGDHAPELTLEDPAPLPHLVPAPAAPAELADTALPEPGAEPAPQALAAV